MALTIRERIMAHWAGKLQTMAANGYSTSYDKVVRAPLRRVDKNIRNIVSILDVSESTTLLVGVVDINLTVLVEFRVKLSNGSEPSTELNKYLGDLKKLFKSDVNTRESESVWLSLDIQIISNELDYDSEDDVICGGFLELAIRYRQNPSDPTLKS